jgi:aminopeptidase C
MQFGTLFGVPELHIQISLQVCFENIEVQELDAKVMRNLSRKEMLFFTTLRNKLHRREHGIVEYQIRNYKRIQERQDSELNDRLSTISSTNNKSNRTHKGMWND